jgi:hypothetical protein
MRPSAPLVTRRRTAHTYEYNPGMSTHPSLATPSLAAAIATGIAAAAPSATAVVAIEEMDAEEGEGRELVEGGNVRVALPAAMLATCTSLGYVLNVATWREVLDSAERDALRTLLPYPNAPDGDVEALIAKLFNNEAEDPAKGSIGYAGAPAGGSVGASLSSEQYFHFGNPATRVWREIQARERHPEVMRHKAAIATVERG